MLSVFVILGCAGCFFAGLIAGVEIGSKETLRQLDEDINF
jgi:hypothetical protein